MDEFFKWDPRQFGLGIAPMDAEHQQLIGLMNELHRLTDAGAGRTLVDRSVKALLSYTIKHFADEEAYMESQGFPGLPTHRLIHQKLLSELQVHIEEYEQSGMPSKRFFDFLRRWLTAHITGIDTKYAQHATGR